MNKIIISIALFVSISVSVVGQAISGSYAIKNVKTGMLLRPKNASKADNAPIVLYSPTNWKCLTWDFKHVNSNVYQLVNLFSNKTFSADKVADVRKLKQTPYVKDEKSQQWIFEDAGKSIYRIRLVDSELYITPIDKNGEVNSELSLDSKIDGDLQLWTIYEQNPSY